MNTRRPRTSCTPCRSGRIGCDAAIQKPAACSNCVRRGKVCDLSTTTAHSTARRNREDGFSGATLRQSSNGSISEAPTWDEGSSDVLIHAITRASAAAVPQDPASQFFEARSPSFSDSFLVLSPSTFDATSIASRRLQATMLNGLLWDIYFKVFELRNTIWLGNSCSPYLDFIPVRAVPARMVATELTLQLDRNPGPRSSSLYSNSILVRIRKHLNHKDIILISQAPSLRKAARTLWLPA